MDQLQSFIASERRALAEYIHKLPDQSYWLFEIVRTFDYANTIQYSDHKSAAAHRELLSRWDMGLNYILRDFVTAESLAETGIRIAPATNDTTSAAGWLLNWSGNIAGMQYLLDHCRNGLFKFERLGDAHVRLTANPQHMEPELLDMMNFEYRAVLTTQHDAKHYKDLDDEEAGILAKLPALVRPFYNDYIAYDGDDGVTEHFHARGMLRAHQLLGVDDFPDHAIFGGYSFAQYQEAAGTSIGIALKHEKLCEALITKHPNIDLRNILVIHQTKPQLMEGLEIGMGIDSKAAAHFIDVLTLGPDNAGHHLDTFDSVCAPHIRASRDMYLRPVLTARENPFYFLLRELQRRFPADWSRETRHREDFFRQQIYEVLNPGDFLQYNRPIRLNAPGRQVTDVDAALIDHSTGTLALFQLKWQDLYDRSPRHRQSRRLNLMDRGNKWVRDVNSWLAAASPRDISSTFHLPLDQCKKLTRRLLFVIARNRANFSTTDQLEPGAAWGTFWQLLKLRNEMIISQEDVLGTAWELLLEERAQPVANAVLDSLTVMLKGMRIDVITHP